jgi:hypothetical protein
MLLSQIKQLLDETTTIEMFREEIKAELAGYKKLYTESGVTIPVHLKEDIYYLFSETHFETLKSWLDTKKLHHHEVSYICDALTLSGMTIFENDTLMDKIESLVITND